MAFKPAKRNKAKLQLFGLIDTVFILLLFFIVTLTVGSERKEYTFKSSLPRSGRGYANAVIQILGANRYKWMEYEELRERVDNFEWSVNPEMAIKNSIENTPEITRKQALNRLRSYMERVNNVREARAFRCYVLILCSENIKYGDVIDVLNVINMFDNPYINYGLAYGAEDALNNVTVQVRNGEFIVDYKH